MALVKCPECGKEISDMAHSCPNCGRPMQVNGEKINNANQSYQQSATNQNYQQHNMNAQMQKKSGCGCLSFFIVLILILAVIIIIIVNTAVNEKNNPDKDNDSIAAEYIELETEQGDVIDTSLNACGITDITSFEHDELLDNAHAEGETGYRIESGDIDNIILYLNADKSVYSIRYADYDLYSENKVQSTLQDYTFTSREMSDWNIKCQEKVKEVLKSPSTAKFPSFLTWGYKKEKNIITIQSYVDSQNGFGAEIRSDFQFIIDTDTDTIQSLILAGEELIRQ